jgi:hypothetical protein
MILEKLKSWIGSAKKKKKKKKEEEQKSNTQPDTPILTVTILLYQFKFNFFIRNS